MPIATPTVSAVTAKQLSNAEADPMVSVDDVVTEINDALQAATPTTITVDDNRGTAQRRTVTVTATAKQGSLNATAQFEPNGIEIALASMTNADRDALVGLFSGEFDVTYVAPDTLNFDLPKAGAT